MSITIYGIKACDTMKKARTWLDDHGVTYAFHDYKAVGIDRASLERWAAQVGWEVLLNRSGTTFRKLADADKADLNQDKAIALHDVDLSLGRGAARVHILKGISLEVDKGEAVGLIGPSGSGKSTLLMTMAGLERPDSGKVIVDGTDLSGLDEDALARFRGRRIGIVFQSFHLVPTMTALENVALPLELAGENEAFERA